MRPAGRVWRRDGRRKTRRAQETTIRELPTRRQQEQALAAETSDYLARQAHIDQANDLPGLLAGLPGVTVMYLDGDL